MAQIILVIFAVILIGRIIGSLMLPFFESHPYIYEFVCSRKSWKRFKMDKVKEQEEQHY